MEAGGESNEFLDEGGGLSSCTSNLLAQWLRNFDSKILSLKIISLKIARRRIGVSAYWRSMSR